MPTPYTSMSATIATGLLGTTGGTQNLVERGYQLLDSTAIPVGRGVVFDASNSSTSGTAVKLPSATGQKFMGIARINPLIQEIDGAMQYVTGEEVTVVEQCPNGVWVTATEAVTPADPVYMQHTTNSGRLPGTFRKDSDSSNADLVDGATLRWADSFGAGLARLTISLP